MLITHELNENPFAAAFMDWRAELRLSRVTVTRSTLVEWRCSFRTTAHVRAAPRGSHRSAAAPATRRRPRCVAAPHATLVQQAFRLSSSLRMRSKWPGPYRSSINILTS